MRILHEKKLTSENFRYETVNFVTCPDCGHYEASDADNHQYFNELQWGLPCRCCKVVWRAEIGTRICSKLLDRSVDHIAEFVSGFSTVGK
jgi:hypothetical protein